MCSPEPLSMSALLSSYHQKIPEELSVIEKKQVYGLATPEDFSLPPHHTLWSAEMYAAFEVSPEASEKYDTKVSEVIIQSLGGTHETQNVDPSCWLALTTPTYRRQLLRRKLLPFLNQTLPQAKYLNHKLSLIVLYRSM